MAISDWPDGEGPRERLLEKGAGSLTDAELLAIFLRTGVKGRNAVELGRELIREFGGLGAVLDAARTDFCAYRDWAPVNTPNYRPSGSCHSVACWQS